MYDHGLGLGPGHCSSGPESSIRSRSLNWDGELDMFGPSPGLEFLRTGQGLVGTHFFKMYYFYLCNGEIKESVRLTSILRRQCKKIS